MNEKKKKIIILTVLFVGLIFVVLYQFLFAGGTKPKSSQSSKAGTSEAAGANKPASKASAKQDSKASGSGTATPSAPESVAPVNIDDLLASIKEVDFMYESAMNQYPRDPMRPLVGPMSPTALVTTGTEEGPGSSLFEAKAIARNMVVTGILWDKDNPMAVLDNQVVHRGYMFDTGIVVEDIEENRVLLRVEDTLIPRELEEP